MALLSVTKNYVAPCGQPMFSGKFIVAIEDDRILKNNFGNRYYKFQWDGTDYYISSFDFTLPNSNQKAGFELLSHYQQTFRFNLLEDIYGSMPKRIQVFCAELDRVEWLENIERNAFASIDTD